MQLFGRPLGSAMAGTAADRTTAAGTASNKAAAAEKLAAGISAGTAATAKARYVKFLSTIKPKKQLFTTETTTLAQTLRFHEGAIWTMK
jgi:hypothetical protein